MAAATGAAIDDLARPAATPALRAAITLAAERAQALLEQSAGFAAMIRDRRLASEVAVIQRLAESLTHRLIDRDPLADIRNTNSLSLVMKNGRLYDANTLDEVYPRQKKLPVQQWMTNAPDATAGIKP